MRFFNIDLHISVVEDIRMLLSEMGHQITSWNMSGHNWVFGRSPASPDVISQKNWDKINPEMCDRFYERYKDELAGYDAFLTTHPPVLSWLFERWHKPIMVVASVRYEVPYSTQPELWKKFTTYLTEGIDSSKIIPIANNKVDAAYAEYFTKRKWTHIPNICGYTGATYSPKKQQFLYYSRLHQYTHYLCGSEIPNLIHKERALPVGYKWSELTQYKGVVAVPYNVSTMSIFEYYTQCMPMFFPTVDLMCQMRKDFESQVLSEMTWNQTWNLTNKSAIIDSNDDPNNFKNPDTFRKWVQLADFYDTDWMPHIQYFNSWDELKNRLLSITSNELKNISNQMAVANVNRKRRVLDLWHQAIQLTGKFKMAGQGQINRGTKLGETIYNLAKQNNIKSIVEIGTWNGLGTTKCVVDAIKGTNKQFMSLEACEGMYRDAVRNNAPIPANVKILHGRIIEESELDTIDLHGDEPKWLEDDRKFYRSCANIYSQIPSKIDLLILDGGEFSSYAEFHKLWQRAKFIIMDDTVVRKFGKVRQEILNSKDFTVIDDSPQDRNGYLVVENISLGHLGGSIIEGAHGDTGTYAPEMWDEMIKMFQLKTIIDVGCGAGYSLKYFLDHHVDGIGVEGWERAIKASPVSGNIVHHDYTEGPFNSGEFDLAWSCEFVEHVEEQYLHNFMATFKSCKRVAMTHALPGQFGHHHVNCQPPGYWIKKLKEIGFKYLQKESEYLKTFVSTQKGGHIWTSLMVFERTNLPIDVDTHRYLYDPAYLSLSLEYAKNLTINGKTQDLKIHFYWRDKHNINDKTIVPLLYALKTQPGARIILWSNENLSDVPELRKMKNKIVFKIWDVKKELQNTPFADRVVVQDDELCYLGGDLFRLLCLYKNGGVYVDMDMILLRDLSPLLNSEFLYEWGSSATNPNEHFKQNGALMHLREKSELATAMMEELISTPPNPKSTCWGCDLYAKVISNHPDTVIYPCLWMNTEWALGIPLSPFKKNANGNNSSELYDGCFCWHWHNCFKDTIEKGSKFDILLKNIHTGNHNNV